ncbi:putative DNA-binding transcriptional regulator YafY [Microbacteriaceae bacterium SG_E_30_P1]|uniref:DNA-binding transcriptional regulator YafY n=1 Tax=Antiquaquibacter oligotrophicus TaxID=2880260 RepID=A0ABT6KQN0_9MICO|nr:WYL domain-containing protein [Antiquaquibacter oligotrophicus]MDH6181509.1 putative DNA-binding transcriptional regulator YafY [Antiquaquibacter oligotrophicus]UDF12801.1 WYL domain-containing protein [Antiquaquibacter oligotrophicus]
MAAPTSRLLELLSLLQSQREWPGTVLASRLGVSPRTVRRDIDRLRELGYRISATMGSDGGYRLGAGEHLPPLLFDDEQYVALTVALRTAAVAGAGIEESALRALTTLQQVMPSRLKHRLDGIRFTVSSPVSAGPVEPELLIALSSAAQTRDVVRMIYGSDEIPRRVEPHDVLWFGMRWYLLAWDRSADDWRIFRADRITRQESTGVRFAPREIPSGSAREYVEARFKGSQTGGWPCVGTVILQRPASAVLPFAGDGTVVDLGDGRCEYTSGSWSWVALAASLGRFDADLEVVAPRELAEAFGVLAKRNAAASK